MSLTLRKECQEQLDNAGFQNYHVDIDGSRHLVIVSECGKPLVTVHGVRFSRTQPTGSEIDYAVELLGSFLIKHQGTLAEFINAKREMEELPDCPEFPTVIPSGTRVTVKLADGLSLQIHENGSVSTHPCSLDSIEDFNTTKVTEEQLAQVQKIADWRKESNELFMKVSKLQSKLNNCAI